MDSINEKTVDIEQVLKSKMGSKAKWVPRPVVKWLKHIIHEDWLNQFLRDNRDLKGTPWLEACVKYVDMHVEVKGLENLPAKDDGRLYTFVSNHPLGGIDGVTLGSILGRQYDDRFRYLVNDLLMTLPGLAPLCIPINKTGAQSRNFPAMVEAGFGSENHILMFPAGLCSRQQNGVIRDLPWKKTQAPGHQVQHRHAVSRRRDVQESGKDFPCDHRQTDTLADFRQVENTRPMGTIRTGRSVQTEVESGRKTPQKHNHHGARDYPTY